MFTLGERVVNQLAGKTFFTKWKGLGELRNYAKARGWKIVQEIQETVSGASQKRPPGGHSSGTQERLRPPRKTKHSGSQDDAIRPKSTRLVVPERHESLQRIKQQSSFSGVP